MASGVGGLHRGGVVDADYRWILPNSRLNSSHASSPAPISDISVTRGVALVTGYLSPSFKLGVVHTRLLFLSMYSARYCLATSYCYDFSPLKAHDLAKLTGLCRSVRSKARAKGPWGVLGSLAEYPTEAVRTIKLIYSSISAIYGDSLNLGRTSSPL